MCTRFAVLPPHIFGPQYATEVWPHASGAEQNTRTPENDETRLGPNIADACKKSTDIGRTRGKMGDTCV